MKEESIQVICYSGYKLNEKPKKFFYKNQEFFIQSVKSVSLVESLNKGTRAIEFAVVCENNQSYRLRYDTAADTWSLVV